MKKDKLLRINTMFSRLKSILFLNDSQGTTFTSHAALMIISSGTCLDNIFDELLKAILRIFNLLRIIFRIEDMVRHVLSLAVFLMCTMSRQVIWDWDSRLVISMLTCDGFERNIVQLFIWFRYWRTTYPYILILKCLMVSPIYSI